MFKNKVISLMLVCIMVFSVSAPVFADLAPSNNLTDFGRKIILENGEELEIVSEEVISSGDGLYSDLGIDVPTAKRIVYLIDGEKMIHEVETLANGDISLNIIFPSNPSKNEFMIVPRSDIKGIENGLNDLPKPLSDMGSENLEIDKFDPNYNYDNVYDDWEVVGTYYKDLFWINVTSTFIVAETLNLLTARIYSILSVVIAGTPELWGLAARFAYAIGISKYFHAHGSMIYRLSVNWDYNMYKYDAVFYCNNKDVETRKYYEVIDYMD